VSGIHSLDTSVFVSYCTAHNTLINKMKKIKIPKDYIQLFDYGVDFDTRTIYYGFNNVMSMTEMEPAEVNDWSTEQFIKGLHLLDSINHNTINVIWSSHGGDWDAGMAAYEYIRLLKSPVKITSYSRCRSMGTVIMQAATTRILTKNSTFMIHYGVDGIGPVHSKDFINSAQQSTVINKKMEDIYLKKIKEKHPKYTRKQLQELMKYDKYMTAKEAVDLGLADKVI